MSGYEEKETLGGGPAAEYIRKTPSQKEALNVIKGELK